MAKKKQPEPDAKPKPRKGSRDYSQRAHDVVREVEERHADRHPEDKN
jgi:hypothetical protein